MAAAVGVAVVVVAVVVGAPGVARHPLVCGVKCGGAMGGGQSSRGYRVGLF